MLLASDGEPLKPHAMLAWALTWALGVGLGVGLGGYLTLTSGAGAPGRSALDPVTDLVVLPLVAFAVVLIVHLIGQVLAGLVRSGRASRQIAGNGRTSDE
ncbi:MAG: hypothetical protein LLG08_08245 [Actinomycetia bacterium]|nr:hypothetical protein [Actinomycetes bacterium]